MPIVRRVFLPYSSILLINIVDISYVNGIGPLRDSTLVHSPKIISLAPFV